MDGRAATGNRWSAFAFLTVMTRWLLTKKTRLRSVHRISTKASPPPKKLDYANFSTIESDSVSKNPF